MKTNAKPKLVKTKARQNLQFKIERGVPIAKVSYSISFKPNPYEAEFKAMNPDNNPPDSILIGKDKGLYGRIHYQATKWGKKNDAAFSFRNTPDGYRMWRVK